MALINGLPARWLKYEEILQRLMQWPQQARAPHWANLLLVTLIAYGLADLSWRLLPAPLQEIPPPATTLAVVASKEVKSWDIAQWHLMGEAGKQEEAPILPQAIELPETRLNLVLRGVIAGKSAAESGAIIADPSGNQKFYALGAKLPGGAELKEIHADHIILLRNGQFETLRLPRDELRDNDLRTDDTAARRRPNPMPAIGPELPPESFMPQPQSLREYRDVLLTNPQQLADTIRYEMVNEDGVRGFRVSPGRDQGLFMQAGLIPGDVVTSVNGIALDNPARGLSILRTLGNRDQVTVEIIRDGIPQSLDVNLNQ